MSVPGYPKAHLLTLRCERASLEGSAQDRTQRPRRRQAGALLRGLSGERRLRIRGLDSSPHILTCEVRATGEPRRVDAGWNARPLLRCLPAWVSAGPRSGSMGPGDPLKAANGPAGPGGGGATGRETGVCPRFSARLSPAVFAPGFLVSPVIPGGFRPTPHPHFSSPAKAGAQGYQSLALPDLGPSLPCEGGSWRSLLPVIPEPRSGIRDLKPLKRARCTSGPRQVPALRPPCGLGRDDSGGVG